MFFNLQLPTTRPRSNSNSSASSTASITPSSSPPALCSRGWTPSCAVVSPAETTTPSGSMGYFMAQVPKLRRSSSTSLSSLSSSPSDFSLLSSSHATHIAYPSWPARASLNIDIVPHSPTAATFDAPPSSRISDDDLECLDFSRRGLEQGISAAVLSTGAGVISWSDIGHASAAHVQEQRRRRLPPPPVMVRGNGSKGRREPSKKLRVIAE